MSTRVCVFGGGAIGSWLVVALLQAKKAEIVFIVRGEHGRIVKEQGLKLRKHQDNEKTTTDYSTEGVEIYNSIADA